VAFVAVCSAVPHDASLKALFQAKWSNFKATHKKEYLGHEEPHRLQQFLESSHLVETHNERHAKGLESFHIALNDMSDLSPKEFNDMKCGYSPSRQTLGASQNASTFVSSGLAAPPSVDWRQQGAVTPVSNQGGCGSCYTFASAGALEGAFFRRTGRLVKLSEQHLLDCSGRYGNGGCDGGLMTNTYNYVIQNRGISSYNVYPYQERVMQCRWNPQYNAGTISSYSVVNRNSESSLMEAVAQVGPISVAMDASPRNLMMYRGGVFNNPACSPTQLNHAVTLVGYGTEGGIPYWLIKNSWGAQWGEGGYVKIARAGNQCGITTDASFPTV